MPDKKETHAKACDDHQKAVEKYIETKATAYASFFNLINAINDARKAAIDCCAVKVDEEGNIQPGWYTGAQDPQRRTVEAADNRGILATAGAGGIVGGIAAPARAWFLVGTLGTASTGTAIGGLSGAAATSATAAWFGGGSVAAGGLGMAAAPFALTGIGLVVGLTAIGVATLFARHRNTNNEKTMDEANATMKEAERRMDTNASKPMALQQSATQTSTKLVKATGVLEAMKNEEAANLMDQALKEAEELLEKLEDPLPFHRLYLGKPSLVKTLIQSTSTKNSNTLQWEDPDGGESEITRYRIKEVRGFWEDDLHLTNVTEGRFIHNHLEPGKTYRYRIIASNIIGDAEATETFEVRTQRE